VQVAVPLILLDSVAGFNGAAVFGEEATGASGRVQVISISASFPQLSHLQTCFLTMFDICFPFLSGGFEKSHGMDQINLHLQWFLFMIQTDVSIKKHGNSKFLKNVRCGKVIKSYISGYSLLVICWSIDFLAL
jgi:hypothetical protein